MGRRSLKKNDSHKTPIVFFACIFLLLLLFLAALIVGKYSIGFTAFFKALFTGDEAFSTQRSVIMNLRLPRTLMAVLVGSALSLSGLVYQELFQNKLVSPDFLGVSSGAGVGAAFAILIGMSGFIICLFSFAFGILTVVITLFIAQAFKGKSPFILLLSGIVVSGFMTACISLIKFMADSDSTLGEITFWLLGSFSKVVMNDVYVMLPICLMSFTVLFVIRWRLNIIALGMEEAQSRGMNYKVYRIALIFIVTLLTASSVAFSGVIGWVGLVVPHIIRLLVGRDNKKTVPLSIFIGAIFMVVCDIVSRSFTFSEIPLSAATGFIGTPIFIGILIFKRRFAYE